MSVEPARVRQTDREGRVTLVVRRWASLPLVDEHYERMRARLLAALADHERGILDNAGLQAAIAIAAPLRAQTARPQITDAIDESKVATLPGNTTPAAALKTNDRGPVADDLRLDHILILLKRDPQT